MLKVANCHCDLLSYLEQSSTHTPYDLRCRTAIPQWEQGGVVLETLVTFVRTSPGCSKSGLRQFEIFKTLKLPSTLRAVLAVENGSCFLDEEEALDLAFTRLEAWAPLLYISLTWNDANRFGGGNATDIGLKTDGQEILKWMSGKKIAIDLSHTSDRLAYDILNFIDAKKLDITPIASHSNFRSICPHERNLPDELALEIGRRHGLIGLNFVRKFLGSKGATNDLVAHVEHAAALNLFDHFCFGADFFDDSLATPGLEHLKPFFYPGYDDASCYPKVINLLQPLLTPEQLEKIAYSNLSNFVNNASSI
jgi:membrane dipeptidase